MQKANGLGILALGALGVSFNREGARVQVRCAALHNAAKAARNYDQISCSTECYALVSWLF